MRLSRAAIFVASIAAAFAQDGALPIFNGRALAAPQGAPLDLRVRRKAFERSALGRVYAALHAERSLLLYDCVNASTAWCAQPDFQFSRVIGDAAARVGSSAAQLESAWRTSFAEDRPLLLSAIVNRADLARWSNGRWESAELRFVYSVDAPLQLTVIVEFVLPPFDWNSFRAYGRSWEALSGTPPGSVLRRLNTALSASGFSQAVKVRIRANREDTGDWLFREWDLYPGMPLFKGQPLRFSRLEDQFHRRYNLLVPGTQDYYDYLAAWNPATAVPEGIVEPANLWRRGRLYPSSEPPLATPQGYCASTSVRNTLALQQCTGCHMSETHNVPGAGSAGFSGFTHISARNVKTDSVLSPFLAGNAPNISLDDLYRAQSDQVAACPDPVCAGFVDNVWIVTLHFDHYGANGDCNSKTSEPVILRFHDLARRKLFLAALITAGRQSERELNRILQFATDYPH